MEYLDTLVEWKEARMGCWFRFVEGSNVPSTHALLKQDFMVPIPVLQLNSFGKLAE